MGFLPDGYEIPGKSGSFMKFQDGENRFRVLANPILDWADSDWGDPVEYDLVVTKTGKKGNELMDNTNKNILLVQALAYLEKGWSYSYW